LNTFCPLPRAFPQRRHSELARLADRDAKARYDTELLYVALYEAEYPTARCALISAACTAKIAAGQYTAEQALAAMSGDDDDDFIIGGSAIFPYQLESISLLIFPMSDFENADIIRILAVVIDRVRHRLQFVAFGDIEPSDKSGYLNVFKFMYRLYRLSFAVVNVTIVRADERDPVKTPNALFKASGLREFEGGEQTLAAAFYAQQLLRCIRHGAPAFPLFVDGFDILKAGDAEQFEPSKAGTFSDHMSARVQQAIARVAAVHEIDAEAAARPLPQFKPPVDEVEAFLSAENAQIEQPAENVQHILGGIATTLNAVIRTAREALTADSVMKLRQLTTTVRAVHAALTATTHTAVEGKHDDVKADAKTAEPTQKHDDGAKSDAKKSDANTATPAHGHHLRDRSQKPAAATDNSLASPTRKKTSSGGSGGSGGGGGKKKNAPMSAAASHDRYVKRLYQKLCTGATEWLENNSRIKIDTTPIVVDTLPTYARLNEETLKAKYLEHERKAAMGNVYVNFNRAAQGACVKRLRILNGGCSHAALAGKLKIKAFDKMGNAVEKSVSSHEMRRYESYYELTRRYPWITYGTFSDVRDTPLRDIQMLVDQVEGLMFPPAQLSMFLELRDKEETTAEDEDEQMEKEKEKAVKTKSAAKAAKQTHDRGVVERIEAGTNCCETRCHRAVSVSGWKCTFPECPRRAHPACAPEGVDETTYRCPGHAKESSDDEATESDSDDSEAKRISRPKKRAAARAAAAGDGEAAAGDGEAADGDGEAAAGDGEAADGAPAADDEAAEMSRIESRIRAIISAEVSSGSKTIQPPSIRATLRKEGFDRSTIKKGSRRLREFMLAEVARHNAERKRGKRRPRPRDAESDADGEAKIQALDKAKIAAINCGKDCHICFRAVSQSRSIKCWVADCDRRAHLSPNAHCSGASDGQGCSRHGNKPIGKSSGDDEPEGSGDEADDGDDEAKKRRKKPDKGKKSGEKKSDKKTDAKRKRAGDADSDRLQSILSLLLESDQWMMDKIGSVREAVRQKQCRSNRFFVMSAVAARTQNTHAWKSILSTPAGAHASLYDSLIAKGAAFVMKKYGRGADAAAAVTLAERLGGGGGGEHEPADPAPDLASSANPASEFTRAWIAKTLQDPASAEQYAIDQARPHFDTSVQLVFQTNAKKLFLTDAARKSLYLLTHFVMALTCYGAKPALDLSDSARAALSALLPPIRSMLSSLTDKDRITHNREEFGELVWCKLIILQTRAIHPPPHEELEDCASWLLQLKPTADDDTPGWGGCTLDSALDARVARHHWCTVLAMLCSLFVREDTQPHPRRFQHCTLCKQIDRGVFLTLSCHPTHTFHTKCLREYKRTRGNSCPALGCKRGFTAAEVKTFNESASADEDEEKEEPPPSNEEIKQMRARTEAAAEARKRNRAVASVEEAAEDILASPAAASSEAPDSDIEFQGYKAAAAASSEAPDSSGSSPDDDSDDKSEEEEESSGKSEEQAAADGDDDDASQPAASPQEAEFDTTKELQGAPPPGTYCKACEKKFKPKSWARKCARDGCNERFCHGKTTQHGVKVRGSLFCCQECADATDPAALADGGTPLTALPAAAAAPADDGQLSAAAPSTSAASFKRSELCRTCCDPPLCPPGKSLPCANPACPHCVHDTPQCKSGGELKINCKTDRDNPQLWWCSQSCYEAYEAARAAPAPTACVAPAISADDGQQPPSVSPTASNDA
jgi:hypothetical protein